MARSPENIARASGGRCRAATSSRGPTPPTPSAQRSPAMRHSGNPSASLTRRAGGDGRAATFRGFFVDLFITDFSPVADIVLLQNAVFTALRQTGPLAPGLFHRGAVAADQSDRILYDPQ